MVSINDNDILDRIIENLKASTNDLFGTTSNDPKFSQIRFGDPAHDNKLSEAGNVCYVRMADRPLAATKKILRMQLDRKRKIETKEVWLIIVTDNINNLEIALRTLHDLIFKTKEAIEKNIFLKKPDGIQTPTQIEIDTNPNDNLSVPLIIRATPETPGNLPDTNIIVSNVTSPSLLTQRGKWEYVAASRFTDGRFLINKVRKIFWVT